MTARGEIPLAIDKWRESHSEGWGAVLGCSEPCITPCDASNVGKLMLRQSATHDPYQRAKVRIMRSAAAKVTSKGQITIPQEVRERLGLHAGDRVVFRMSDEVGEAEPVAMGPERGRGRSTLIRIPDLASLGGTMHPPPGRSHTWAEIREAAWDEEVQSRR